MKTWLAVILFLSLAGCASTSKTSSEAEISSDSAPKTTVVKIPRCMGNNDFGKFPEGGGCNLYGCWAKGGYCNQFGCSAMGSCTVRGCPKKVEPLQCQDD